jgi:hypothetical protein
VGGGGRRLHHALRTRIEEGMDVMAVVWLATSRSCFAAHFLHFAATLACIGSGADVCLLSLVHDGTVQQLRGVRVREYLWHCLGFLSHGYRATGLFAIKIVSSSKRGARAVRI